MDLSDNDFHGVLTKNWGSSKQLTNLWIARNKISGVIPPEIGDIAQLRWLDLSSNHIVGEIPKEFGELTSLENLDLSKNMLNGSIPQYMGGFWHLLTLNLSWNDLSGPIPSGFEKLKNLSFVDLSYNNLEGYIPNIMKYMNATLEGNRGLCGNMDGFEPCQSFHSSRTGNKKFVHVVIIVIPIIVALMALFGFVEVCLLYRRRKCVEYMQSNESQILEKRAELEHEST